MSPIGQPGTRRLHSGRAFSRTDLIHKVKERLLRHGLPRLQMCTLLTLTGAAGFFTSYGLLQWGVDSMALRYPVAVGAAWGVFLLLLRLWLLIQERGWGDLVDAGDAVDMVDAGADGLGLGMRQGGGFSRSGGGGGSGFDFSFDLDESAVLVVVAILILAATALGVAFWVVWTAPVLLAEVLVDGLILTGLYHRLKHAEEPEHWLFGVVRRTWIPALVTALLFSVSGWLLQRAAPEARSIGAAWQVVTQEKSPGDNP